MKKIYLFIALIVALLLPSFASAHNVYNVDGTVVVSTIDDKVFNDEVARAMQRSFSADTKIYPPGFIFYTSTGKYFDTCPVWYFRGCVLYAPI